MKKNKILWITVIIVMVIFVVVGIFKFKEEIDKRLLEESVNNIPIQGIITTTNSVNSVLKDTSTTVISTVIDENHQKIESTKVKTNGKEEKFEIYVKDKEIYVHAGEYYQIVNQEYINDLIDKKNMVINDQVTDSLLKKAKITGEDTEEEIDGETINIRNITIDFTLDNVDLLKYIEKEKYPELYDKVSTGLENMNSYDSSVVYKINKDKKQVLSLDSVTHVNVDVIGDIVTNQTIDYTKAGEDVEFEYPAELDEATPISSMEDLYVIMMD